ncbi:MAG TPA: phosphatidate cytidylyltransferase, partial [Treponemataceae bacterium]|nr:phosphatidate cytidylyltransferase [Treponemataceae bacterium]
NISNNFDAVISKISSTILIIFYIPFLFVFVGNLSVLEYSREFLVLFLLLVFACDSFAWFFGVLFGNGTRGLISVSKNKSLIGFIGGIVSTIAIAYTYSLFFPHVFLGYHIKVSITGLCTALAAICGDLAESALKRSAAVKDSGSIMPGRGGIMDSIDSILFAAPIYYMLIMFFFV